MRSFVKRVCVSFFFGKGGGGRVLPHISLWGPDHKPENTCHSKTLTEDAAAWFRRSSSPKGFKV